MTTAARPTWAPAKGGEEQGGTRIFGPSQKYSSRDIASHTTLKTRKEGQDTQEEIKKRNLREELEDRERKHFSSKDRNYSDERDRRRGAATNGLYLESGGGRRDGDERLAIKNIDADDSDAELKAESDSSDDDDDDDEDDTEALLAELERIKKEREEEKLRKERQRQEEESKVKEAELVRGNPLLNTTSFAVKRRWDDDVVFKNQTRGEPKAAKRVMAPKHGGPDPPRHGRFVRRGEPSRSEPKPKNKSEKKSQGGNKQRVEEQLLETCQTLNTISELALGHTGSFSTCTSFSPCQ